MTKIVKIVSSAYDYYWYKGMIGQYIEVEEVGEISYVPVLSPNGMSRQKDLRSRRVIIKEDCEDVARDINHYFVSYITNLDSTNSRVFYLDFELDSALSVERLRDHIMSQHSYDDVTILNWIDLKEKYKKRR